MEIQIRERDNKGYVIAHKDGKRIGMMTYSNTGSGFIIIDHTEVEPEHQGAGVGERLLELLVNKAREESFKIMPLCPFASAMFKRHEELSDVLQ
jgi:predicted GNAT family acetyltransferase